MPKHAAATNRVYVTRRDYKAPAFAGIVVTCVIVMGIGAYLLPRHVSAAFGLPPDTATWLLLVPLVMMVGTFIGPKVIPAVVFLFSWQGSPRASKQRKRVVNMARFVKGQAIAEIDHERLRAHVKPRFFSHGGRWSLAQLEFELQLTRQGKRFLRAMVVELEAASQLSIAGHVISFSRPDYRIPDRSPHRSTPYVPPKVRVPALERKFYVEQSSVACAGPVMSASGSKGAKPKRRKVEKKGKAPDKPKRAEARHGSSRPRRAAPKLAETKERNERFNSRVLDYILARGKKGDGRLSFEQIQHGLGVADGKVNKLRAELDKLVRRGFMCHGGGWYVFRPASTASKAKRVSISSC